MKAYNICCKCGKNIELICKDTYFKKMLEEKPSIAICHNCEPDSKWRVFIQKEIRID